jgi:hypothetical protein
MTAARRVAAETLIQLASDILRDDIAPALPPDKRYAMAMAMNALAIARRDILTDGETPLWDLLDTVYPDGDGSAAKLAQDIRNGDIQPDQPPDLLDQLKQILIAELRVKNPRFLKQRGIEG